mmetsp:Transcript_15968/g.43025  ORF Transcript_15968/g.43025 Transcript_15968/m.43025 type:complete len:313 (-) Transcript_15968:828-1766(-)
MGRSSRVSQRGPRRCSHAHSFVPAKGWRAFGCELRDGIVCGVLVAFVEGNSCEQSVLHIKDGARANHKLHAVVHELARLVTKDEYPEDSTVVLAHHELEGADGAAVHVSAKRVCVLGYAFNHVATVLDCLGRAESKVGHLGRCPDAHGEATLVAEQRRGIHAPALHGLLELLVARGEHGPHGRRGLLNSCGGKARWAEHVSCPIHARVGRAETAIHLEVAPPVHRRPHGVEVEVRRVGVPACSEHVQARFPHQRLLLALLRDAHTQRRGERSRHNEGARVHLGVEEYLDVGRRKARLHLAREATVHAEALEA